MNEETHFRWPEDGSHIHLLQDVIASLADDQVTIYLIPKLAGRSAVVAYLLWRRVEPQTIMQRLELTPEQLRGIAAIVLDATQELTGETLIMPIERKIQ